MHYYRFSISDYRADTAHLTPMEHYVYRQLIDWYYLDEKPIPKKTQTVLRRLKLETEHEEMLSNVLQDFFEEGENGWIHHRIESDIAEYHSKAEKNKRNGKKGGRPKKQELSEDEKPKKTQSVSVENPNESLRNPNHLTKEPPNQETDLSPNGDMSAETSSADLLGDAPKKQKPPTCPHQAIIDLYHEKLPECPMVREWNDTRKKYLQTRWREDAKRQSLEWWARFFEYVAASQFLTGKTEGRNGQPPFVANLEWLIKPANFAKIVEGNYHREAA